MSREIYPQLPWRADPDDSDNEMFRVIRGVDGRPIFFISRWLSSNEQEDVARLVVASPQLLAALRAVFFAKPGDNGGLLWNRKEWTLWRQAAGPLLADLWPQDWEMNK